MSENEKETLELIPGVELNNCQQCKACDWTHLFSESSIV